ncbi:condensation domain-containing protein [Crossiella sp. SN42]|uniref:condensation domain-containing protein n=1 Tax=Crossiella sp. SN42 TaxID=2944808 RepID=UPI00207D6178|nr:condensation domain-containing protein [Crossiella sp. SN42]MCO1577272.1 condensation domain-containing protein [Crossiella sp. SN42]
MSAEFRSGPLSWAQQYHWLEQQLDPSERFLSLSLSLYQHVPVPEGLDRAAVLAALRELVTRHEVLRSLFPSAEPVQRVCAPDLPPVLESTVDGDRTAIAAELTGDEFDLDTSWPCKAVLFGPAEHPSGVVLALHHIAVDGWGAQLAATELAELLAAAAAGRPAELAEPRWHPLDQAERETTGNQKSAQRVHEHWLELIASIPANTLAPFCGGIPAGHSHLVTLRSASLATALRTLAEQHRVSPATVLTAALARLVAARTGEHRVAMDTVVANRFDQATEHSVGCYALLGQAVLEVDPAQELPALFRPAYSASLRAYKHGNYDSIALLAAEARATFDRGVSARAPLEVNYHPYHEDDEAEVPAADELTEQTVPEPAEQLYLNIHPGKQVVEISLRAADHLLTLAESSRLLHALAEDVRAAAGLTPPRAPEPAPQAQPGWTRVGRDWVNTEATAEALLAVPGVLAAEAHVAGEQLVAEVLTTDPELDPADLHGHLMAELLANPLVAAPRRYRLRLAGEHTPGWRELPVTKEGDGRRSPAGRELTPEEAILTKVLEARYPDRTFDLANCFAGNGGNLADAPALAEQLRAAGLEVSTAQFLLPLPLNAIGVSG